MPPKPKSQEQLLQDKENIIETALKLIQKNGLQGLTMRKLSTALNMSAANLYNYFYNKDEIYLHILISGFRKLQKLQQDAIKPCSDPIERLYKFMHQFLQFGIKNPNYYHIMFSTFDPKAMEYTGTSVEKLAHSEKTIAMETFAQLVDLIKACVPCCTDEEISITATRIVCELHGGVNLCHTNILREIGTSSDLVLNNLVEHILSEFI